ncbi:MAG: hypothetical protein AAGM22_32730 [Acidobacteriota bacterium]
MPGPNQKKPTAKPEIPAAPPAPERQLEEALLEYSETANAASNAVASEASRVGRVMENMTIGD